MFKGIPALFVPDTGGAIWIGLLVALLLFGDLSRLRSARNLAILGLLVTSPFMNNMAWWGYRQHPTLARWGWTAIFLIVLVHTIWSFRLARPMGRPGWVPNLALPGLKILAALMVTMNVLTGLAKSPEDAGVYINLGAQRWLETGMLPYGDPKLNQPDSPGFGAAATYGPLLYLAHVPAVLLLGGRQNPPDASLDRATYKRPADIGTQVVSILFHLAGLAAIFLIARRLAGEEAAWGAVCLYACMPYLAGLDGGEGSISGLRFISHMAPTAFLLLGVAAVEMPFVSGVLLACAGGLLFFPVFMFPAWFGWRWWRDKQPWRFFAGAAVAGAAILALVIAFTPAESMLGSVRAFLHAVVEHQEGVGPHQYGTSTFGFWGTHPALTSVLHTPVVAGSPFTEPTFAAFIALCLFAGFWVRKGGVVTLIAITAAIGAAVQLWKTHGGGTYIEWYLPFLILALIIGDRETAAPGVASPDPA